MNKIISAFLQEHSLTYNSKEKLFHGSIHGYQASGSVQTFSNMNVLSFHVCLPEERQGEANQFLAGISKTYGIREFRIEGDGIVCVLMTSMKKYVAHEKCFDEYVEKVKNDEAAAKAAPSNLPKALGGMVLGVLAGCVLWVIFFALGFISWWAPVVSGFLGAFLWDKFGGKNDKVKIICMWAISLVLLTLTLFLSYYVDILNAANEVGVTMREALEILFADPEFKSALLQDVIISYVFITVANAVVTVQIVQTQKLLSKTFRKL